MPKILTRERLAMKNCRTYKFGRATCIQSGTQQKIKSWITTATKMTIEETQKSK